MKIEGIKRIIKSNECYCFSLPCICEKAGIKYNTMRIWFKGFEKESLKDFYQGCRLKYSIELLRNKDYKISSIAYEVGFKNEEHFIRWFKKKTSETPDKFSYIKIGHGKYL